MDPSKQKCRRRKKTEEKRSVENINVKINSSKLKKVEEGDRSVELLWTRPNRNVEEGRRQNKTISGDY